MKSILCFGDSNTWGASPVANEPRYQFDQRWPGVLQNILGAGARIIEEGLPGRTTCFDDPYEVGRNGKTYLPVVLASHSPLDLAIIMLGTNDIKLRFNQSAEAIAGGAAVLVEMCQKYETPVKNVLLVSPAHIVETEDQENRLAWGSPDKSQLLAQYYKFFAENLKCNFFDAASVIQSSSIDGVHLDLAAHKSLGEALAAQVRKII